jgi:arylsulfatase A-like enzyme
VLVIAVILVSAACASDTPPTANGGAAASTTRVAGTDPGIAPGTGPNIVLIMTDDQPLESLVAMPRTRELLGAGGVTFSNAFATFPLCCPARATILTGQYAHNHGVRNNVPPDGGNDALDHTNTLPVWLRAAGYATSFVGKYLNGYGTTSDAFVPDGWDSWFGLYDPDAEIFTENLAFFDYKVLADGQVTSYGNADEDYQTDVIAERTVTEIERLSAGDRPFFLWLATVAPHAGGGRGAPNDLAPAPAPRHLGTYADEPLLDAPNVFEEDLGDKPAWVREYEAKANEVVVERGLPPLSTLMVETWRAHLESLLAVDEAVADTVDALERAGVLDDTIIVFTSDNGLLLGQHRLPDAKIAPYEESIRVPFFVRGPGFSAGSTITAPVAHLDLAATFVQLAGADAGLTLDGVPLQDIVADPAGFADRALLLESPPGGTNIIPHFDGVRVPGYSYADYGLDESGGAVRELYDLEADPYQLENKADDPAYVATMDALAGIVARLETCAGVTCQVDARVG